MRSILHNYKANTRQRPATNGHRNGGSRCKASDGFKGESTTATTAVTAAAATATWVAAWVAAVCVAATATATVGSDAARPRATVAGAAATATGA
jgi:hypothetical protein